jgi:hypothetical protein
MTSGTVCAVADLGTDPLGLSLVIPPPPALADRGILQPPIHFDRLCNQTHFAASFQRPGLAVSCQHDSRCKDDLQNTHEKRVPRGGSAGGMGHAQVSNP